MEQPLISVIVPVYKVEPYLDKCISSIANQTYTNMEIILVDDGSPDNCPAMCDAWAEKDNRIRVIHQKNQGGGAARNAGLDFASGGLIAFVDSDDYIAPDMYAHLYELLKAGADIAECSYVEVAGDDAVFACGYETRSYTAQEAMAENIRDRVFRQLIWNKLYRRQMVDGVRFPTSKKIDDEFFTYRVLGNANTLIHSTKVCYAYRQQSESVMHSMPISKRIQAVEAKTQRHTYIKNHFPELTDLSTRDLWFTCIYQGQLALRALNKAEAEKILTYFENLVETHPFQMEGCSLKERLWLNMAKSSLAVACRIRNALKIGL
mgnify:FL=1